VIPHSSKYGHDERKKFAMIFPSIYTVKRELFPCFKYSCTQQMTIYDTVLNTSVLRYPGY